MVTCQSETWRSALANSFTKLDTLLDSLGLERHEIADLDPNPDGFRLLVPRGFAALMRHGDPMDPLLRQVLPLRIERDRVEGFVADPVGDSAADRGNGLLQKYSGRALLMTTGACAIHCRYCFRRHFPYASLPARGTGHQAAIAQIAEDDSLSEVILSGGDPLMLDDAQLRQLLSALDAIPHLRRLRIHTRLPTVLPERITDELCRMLTALGLQTIMVIHANHPHELGIQTGRALGRLTRAGVTLLNQSVLLKDINDDPEVLERLSERLFENGVLPYYVHQLDRVEGAAHFSVADDEAKRLMDCLRQRLPGYLVPRLVREIPGEGSKTPVD